jgi:hypothetical protein
MAFIVEIDGVDRGPAGTNIVRGLTCEVAGKNKIGTATIELTFPSSGGYTFVNTREVRIYETTGVVANVLFGGFIANYSSRTYKGTNRKTVTLRCKDYNWLLDTVYRDAQDAKELTVTAGTMLAQLEQVVQALQENGGGSVNREIEVGDYISTVSGATVLPAFSGKGQSLRWFIQQVMDHAYASDTDLRPRFHINLLPDGSASGVQVSLVVYDAANPSSAVATFSQSPSGAEKGIIDFERSLDASMPIANRGQSVWVRGSTLVRTYEGTASVVDYYNRYINHGEDPGGNSGYMMYPVIEDTESTTSAEAQAVIDRTIQAREYPRETIRLTWDKTPSDSTFIRPGQVVTVVWDDEGLNDDYAVAGVSVDFPTTQQPRYQRFTYTLGLPKLTLFEDGSDGITGAPTISDIVPPSAPTTLIASTAYDPVAGQSWVHLTWTQTTSNDARNNLVYIMQAGTVIEIVELDDLYTEYSYLVPPSTAYQARVAAVDGAGNISEPSNVVSGTSAPPITNNPLNLDYEDEDLADATLPRYHTRDVSGNATATIDDVVFKSGAQSLKLVHGTGAGGDEAGLISNKFLLEGAEGAAVEYSVYAKGELGGERLRIQMTLFDEDGTPLTSPNVERKLTDEFALYSLQHTFTNAAMRMAQLAVYEADTTAADHTIWVDQGHFHPVGTEIKAGYIEAAQVSRLTDLFDNISLVDRARAGSWVNKGTLAAAATFAESSILHVDGTYYVYSTNPVETLNTKLRSASTLEGIPGATLSAMLIPGKYPSVVYDKVTGIWHAWVTLLTPVRTGHYTSLSPTSGWTYSDDVNLSDLLDAGFAKDPTTGYWYGVGFDTSGASSPLYLVRASLPEGPWTNMGNVYADTGVPPFATDGRPDPNLCFVGGRAYLLVTGRPVTLLGNDYYPFIQELNLTTGRVMGSPVTLLDEREAWQDPGVSDIQFLRVEGEPDRLIGFNYPLAALELPKTDIPDDGRTHDDLIRLDPKRGVDVATGIRPLTFTDSKFTSDGLAVTGTAGGAQGYPARATLADFTVRLDYTPTALDAGVLETFAFIGGADYDAAPYIHIFKDTDDTLYCEILGDGGSPGLLDTGYGPINGTPFSLVFRRQGDAIEVWVNGSSLDDDTYSVLLEDIEIYSVAGQKTLTQGMRNMAKGMVTRFEVVAVPLPLSKVKTYPPKPTSGATWPGFPDDGDTFLNTTLNVQGQYSAAAAGWLGPKYALSWSDRATSFQPYTNDNDVLGEYRIRTGRKFWVHEWALWTHVSSLNNGGKFWTIVLLDLSTSFDIVTFNTSADAADTWVEQTPITSFGGNPYDDTDVGFAIQIRMTSGPGGLYIDQAELTVSEVFN